MKNLSVSIVVKQYQTVEVELDDEDDDLYMAINRVFLSSDEFDITGITERETERQPGDKCYTIYAAPRDDGEGITCDVFAPDKQAALDKVTNLVDDLIRIDYTDIQSIE